MPAGVSAYTALANVTLGSSAATVTFSSISQAYRDLVIVFSGKGTAGFVGRFNSDTGTNYNTLDMVGDGSVTASYNTTSTTSLFFANAAINPFDGTTQSSTIITIFDYSVTDKHKTLLNRHDRANGMTVANVGRWASTSAITAIEFRTNFVAGDSFALYGVSA
jgi:hypothetical protein